MKVGDYVRTEYGIAKIKEYEVKGNYNCYYLDNNILDDDEYLGHCLYDYKYYLKQVIKSSPNIIDLIEVGDYVNGIYIDTVEKEQKRVWHTSSYGDDDIVFYNNDIKSIVTKKQFEAMEYKCE